MPKAHKNHNAKGTMPVTPEDFAMDIAALFYSPGSSAKIVTLAAWIRDRDFQIATATSDKLGGSI